MQNEQIIQQLLKEGKGLTQTECEKAAGPHDPLYLQARIKQRQRHLYTARASLALLYLGFTLAVLLLLFGDSGLDPISRNWMIGITVVVLLLSFVGLPHLLSHHGRNILILRMIDHIRTHSKD